MNKILFAFVVLHHIVGCVAHHPGPESLDNGVRFTLFAPQAETVAIAGSFNKWDPRQHLLSDPDHCGIWNILLPLPPGRHEYLFVINDEKWIPDPFAPLVSDGMGGAHSIVVIVP